MIPIGIANEKWKHGNPVAISNTINNLDNIKKQMIYIFILV